MISASTEAQQVKSFKTTDGETLFYTTKGSGPKVILIYGGPGISAGPMLTWAQDIDDLRNHLGEKQVTLCGISWGGGLAQAYAAFYPAKTKNIVLVCSLGPDLSLMSAFNDNINMRRFPSEKDSLRFWNKQPDSELSKMKRNFFSFLPDFYDHNIGNKMLPKFFSAATFHDRMSDLMWKDLSKIYNLVSELKDYKGKCTIIKTRQDVMPEETVYSIKNIIPQTEIRTIERCGHFPDYERPKGLFSLLRKVL